MTLVERLSNGRRTVVVTGTGHPLDIHYPGHFPSSKRKTADISPTILTIAMFGSILAIQLTRAARISYDDISHRNSSSA